MEGKLEHRRLSQRGRSGSADVITARYCNGREALVDAASLGVLLSRESTRAVGTISATPIPLLSLEATQLRIGGPLRPSQRRTDRAAISPGGVAARLLFGQSGGQPGEHQDGCLSSTALVRRSRSVGSACASTRKPADGCPPVCLCRWSRMAQATPGPPNAQSSTGRAHALAGLSAPGRGARCASRGFRRETSF